MESPEIQRVHQLLAAKDDTSRFVGLLLLKTILDNHASSLQHEQVVALWNSISSRFLDRLIRTGSRPASGEQKQSGDMLDAAVAVIYTFSKLLNDCALSEKFYLRIPNLVNAVLYSSEQTTERIVDLIHTLVQQPDGQVAGGATCFAKLDVNGWAPLIEIAPQYQTVFSIFHWAWVKGSTAAPLEHMQTKIDEAFQLFLSSFKGHHPAPLLDFIALILNNLDLNLRSSSPQWLQAAARLIHEMSSSKPTEDSRRAYTHCAATLLAAYPEKAPGHLFSDSPGSSKPVAYLFVKMVQVDIVSTLNILIPNLNTAEYPTLSRRVSAALDITTSFVGFLIAASDDITSQQGFSPDRILKLHEDLVRTIGDVMEYLRDRWDDFRAVTLGIESAQTSKRGIFEDLTTPAAVRLVAIWLRDDDGETLRTQAAGLVELFAELYKLNMTCEDVPEIRLPILAALEGILQTSDGREAFDNTDLLLSGLYPDLRTILASRDVELIVGDYIRGSAIVQIFHVLVEYNESLRSHTGLADLLESISKSGIEPAKARANDVDHSRRDFQIDILKLVVTLLGPSKRSTPRELQPKIKSALENVITNATENWNTVGDEDMTAMIAELRFK